MKKNVGNTGAYGRKREELDKNKKEMEILVPKIFDEKKLNYRFWIQDREGKYARKDKKDTPSIPEDKSLFDSYPVVHRVNHSGMISRLKKEGSWMNLLINAHLKQEESQVWKVITTDDKTNHGEYILLEIVPKEQPRVYTKAPSQGRRQTTKKIKRPSTPSLPQSIKAPPKKKIRRNSLNQTKLPFILDE